MLFVCLEPKAGVMSLNHAERVSLKLAADIKACIDRYLDNQNHWKWSPGVIRTGLSRVCAACIASRA